jgi:hypothetical protein
VADAGTTGVATTLVHSDHKHAREGFGLPAASAVGDAQATGSAATVPHSDHVHARESFGAASGLLLKSTAANGSGASPLRADASIKAFDTTAPVTQAFGDAAAVGTVDFAARRDHAHGMMARTIYGASTASATTTTLPAGDIIPITGTTKITGITAGAAGRQVTLEIASAGLWIANGSNLKLRGDFLSCAALDTLTLHSDGTNWIEDARAMTPPRCDVVNTATQNVAASTVTVVLFDTEINDNAGIHSTVSNTGQFVLPIAGLWVYGASMIWPSGITTGARFVTSWRTNVPVTQSQFENSQPNAGTFLSQNPSRAGAYAAGTVLELIVYQDSSGSLTIASNFAKAWLVWVGPG